MTSATIVASCAAIFPRIRSVWSARRRWSATTVFWRRQRNLGAITETKRFDFACTAIEWHFAGIPLDQLVARSRQFPGHMRADVQAAVDKLFSHRPIRFFGIQERHRYETLTFASLTSAGQAAHAIAPAQYHDVEIGEAEPVKCLDNGLWLCIADDLRYAVLLSAHREHSVKKRASALKSR